MIDLRSDTVTRPTQAMREYMMQAEVGDDVFGEDPTAIRLQEKVAELLGKEATLYVPSGVMANQIALNVHTRPGDEVICHEKCHIFNFESGAPAFLSGVQMHPLPGERGVLTVEQIEAALRPGPDHFPRSRLITIENTHNYAGGTVFPIKEMKRIAAFAREKGLGLHLDGARLWNASVAAGISMAEYAGLADSVSVCLSKGLGAPVGSVIAGSHDFIAEAHRYRKIYGGGMRQIGILAAAGIYAINHHWQRMAEDHIRARRLAEALAEMRGLEIDLESVQTNIVIIGIRSTGMFSVDLLALLREEGVLGVPFGPSYIRLVTHLDVSDSDIEEAIQALGRALNR